MSEESSNNLNPSELALIYEFGRTSKQIEYYGIGHRLAQAALEQLFAACQGALDLHEEWILEITPTQIIVNQKGTDKEDLRAKALAEFIYKKGISGLRLFKGLTPVSLADFMEVLNKEVMPPQGDPFWNLPGLTVWSLILKGPSSEEEKESDEEALRELVRKWLLPLAPAELRGEEEILDWAVREESSLARAMEKQIKEVQPSEEIPLSLSQAKALDAFMTGLTKAYEALCPDKKDLFLEKIALAITEIENWEQIWFSELEEDGTSLFKNYFKLLNPDRCSQMLVRLILFLMNKGSRLVTFLKKCEGELTENQSVMAETKLGLETATQNELYQFTDLWSLVQGIFLDADERQFMDDQYIRQLEGFSEVLPLIDWEEKRLPADLRQAFEKTQLQKGLGITIPYLLEFLITSHDIHDLLFWIKELEGHIQELSLSGDFRQLAMIYQEISRAIATLPFHQDPVFPQVLQAWERLCQIDHTEVFLNSFPAAGEEDRSVLRALLPFVSVKTLANLLKHLEEIDSTPDYQHFWDFLFSAGKQILPPLFLLLKEQPSAAFILKALTIVTHFQAEEFVSIVPDLLSALDESKQMEAVRILASYKVDEMAAILLPHLKRYNSGQQTEVIRILFLAENNQVLWLILKMLHKGSRFSRYPNLSLEEKIIRALGQARYEPAANFCYEILTEKEFFPTDARRKFKEAAGICLQQIGTPQAREWLEEGKKSKIKLTRKICQTILGD
jgi:hypothetical protein